MIVILGSCVIISWLRKSSLTEQTSPRSGRSFISSFVFKALSQKQVIAEPMQYAKKQLLKKNQITL